MRVNTFAMLVFSAQSLAFIAVPKTGTTAVEMALRPHADIIFAKGRKHMTAQQFRRKVAPFLARAFDLYPERFAVMREPEEQIRSWYRYRSAERLRGSNNATGGLSFDEFVLDVIAENPPAHAAIGSQMGMLTHRGEVLVHHLFAHESPLRFRDLLDARFDAEITLKPKNVSPPARAPLDPDVRRRLRVARAAEFDLYTRLRDAGGHLQSPQAAG